MSKFSWSFDPTVYVGIGGLAGAYLWLARGRIDRHSRAVVFLVGLILMWAVLESPLDALGDNYLASAHMMQHLLLAMLVPPLLLGGLSPAMASYLWRIFPGLPRYGEPIPAMVLAMTVMIFWQVPALFDWTLSSQGVHIFAHLSMLIAGTLMWWTILRPTSDQCAIRLSDRGRAACLLMMAIPMLADAAVLWLLPRVIYQPYAADPRLAGWLSPLVDQHLTAAAVAGFGLAYLAAAVLLASRLSSEPGLLRAD